MKCKQCGTEFTGNYCPECGAKNEELYPQIVPKKLNKRNKRLGVKKPFYKVDPVSRTLKKELYTN